MEKLYQCAKFICAPEKILYHERKVFKVLPLQQKNASHGEPATTGAPPVRRPATSGYSSGAAGGRGDRRVDIVCRVKYCNTLPDLPFDPKFITYPFDATRYSKNLL